MKIFFYNCVSMFFFQTNMYLKSESFDILISVTFGIQTVIIEILSWQVGGFLWFKLFCQYVSQI